MALRQQLGMEGDRRLAGSLSVDEVGQFVGNPSNHHQGHSIGLNGSDLYQKRLSPLEEHYCNLRKNHALEDLPEQGNFDPNSTAFGSLNLPADTPGIKVENANSLYLAENLYMHSNNQLGPSSSGYLQYCQRDWTKFHKNAHLCQRFLHPRMSFLIKTHWHLSNRTVLQALQLLMKEDGRQRQI
ncbi:uncharacterized protein LOC120163615 [Hibiscus syriacus]|uniref:uncharacterized protein LOC120163615 n=1 Tax=Hibiscus syriacus TaxID=106335 RepID=UPI0019239CC3|nr:uncharacterized protein LOC120163615 [Hibiscus syriacus]